MQLAEILGHVRGDEIRFQDNPTTDWRCNPHTEVRLPAMGVHLSLSSIRLALLLGSVPAQLFRLRCTYPLAPTPHYRVWFCSK